MNPILKEHLGYLQLPNRLDLYRAAIKEVVRPGDTVLDAGCGTAVLGLLCLEEGAGRLIAVDSTEAIEIARTSLTQAGWGEKCEFIRANVHQLVLPDKVDVVVCDHVGYFGFDYGLIELLADCRRRFLMPAGRMMPRRLRLHAAAVQSESCREKFEAWCKPAIPSAYHWLREPALNSKYSAGLKAADLLSEPVDLCDLDLALDQPAFFSWACTMTASRDGSLDGVAGWFSCELADGIWMTNSPLSMDSIGRSQVFLPIETPLDVTRGDAVRVEVMARPNDRLITWTATHAASGRSCRQSTWFEQSLDPTSLNKRALGHVPKVSAAARGRQAVIAYCDGQRTLGEIQELILRDHPDLFPSQAEIQSFVARVLSEDTD